MDESQERLPCGLVELPPVTFLQNRFLVWLDSPGGGTFVRGFTHVKCSSDGSKIILEKPLEDPHETGRLDNLVKNSGNMHVWLRGPKEGDKLAKVQVSFGDAVWAPLHLSYKDGVAMERWILSGLVYGTMDLCDLDKAPEFVQGKLK